MEEIIDHDDDCSGLHLILEEEDELMHIPDKKCPCEPKRMKAIGENDEGLVTTEGRIWIHNRTH